MALCYCRSAKVSSSCSAYQYLLSGCPAVRSRHAVVHGQHLPQTAEQKGEAITHMLALCLAVDPTKPSCTKRSETVWHPVWQRRVSVDVEGPVSKEQD